MSKKEAQVVEGEFTEVVEEVAVRSELTIGIKEDGKLYFNVTGPDQEIFTIEGLLKYARTETDKLWERIVTPQ
jgi:hypothetical protein